jgi:transcriptional regulator with XRE-family HTH domain
MGTASRRERHSPRRLAEKLLRIRQSLDLSQNGMLRMLGSPDKLSQSNISGYERGVREPPLLILLEYARAAGVYMEVLIDDSLNLPEKLPASPKSEGLRVKGASKAAPAKGTGRRKR